LDPRGEAGYVPRAQDVADWVRSAIHSGRFKAGQPIRQEAVARDLGVSRTPVREALRQLEAEGLVVIRPHSGARVSWLDYEECEESYKIRERLEPLALAESIGRLSGDQLASAEQLTEVVREARGDEQAWLDADRALHLAFYAGVTSERVLGMVIDFWDATARFQRLLLSLYSDDDYALEDSEHRLILDALISGNARAGEALLRAHVERARLRLARNRSLFTS
jgi:DNA-binding GntR family transcriptional regulator